MLGGLLCKQLALALITVVGAIHLQVPNETAAAYVQIKHKAVTQWGFVKGASAVEAEDLIASIAPGGVWMAKSPNLQSKQTNRSKTLSLVEYKKKYGFYLHTFGEGDACIHLLQEVRRVYPGEPIYIMSDGGMNFSGLCNELGNCKFAWKPPANDRWNPYPFFHRFQEAALWLKTKFVIMLEPDNEIRSEIDEEPTFAAGGLNDTNPAFHQEMIDYVEQKGREYSGNKDYKIAWNRFGLAGGSYFSTAAVMEAFDPDHIDWRQIRKFDSKRIYSSDVAMPLALACHGYTYYPWTEITQQRFGLKDSAALRHYGREEVKPLYGQKIKTNELVTQDTPKHVDVDCQGCVWVSDEVCLEKKPIHCPVTGFDLGPPESWQPVNASKNN